MEMSEETVTTELNQDVLFPGGPTMDQVEEWKKKYGLIEMIEVAGQPYIYRIMNRAEHRALLATGKLENVTDSDEFTVKTLLLFPSYDSINWDNIGAGVMQTLSSGMMKLSGFSASSVPIRL